MNLLLLDNYDSFVYNLAQALRALGASVAVVRNDAWSLARVVRFAPAAIVISPGPGSPVDPRYFGVCADVIRELGAEVPTLGVCLGHQGIAHVNGGYIVRAQRVMHGKTSAISHTESGVFRGLPQGFQAMRYHSLVVDPDRVPTTLRVTARASDGTIMGLEHQNAPLHGVQFHPESIGTPCGRQLLDNFLALAR
ncbi:MAG: aminodeoxychorismate/anthranilate synthase component II [Polyangiales bacterium]